MNLFQQQNTGFQRRHNGPSDADTELMLSVIGLKSIRELVNKTVPYSIRLQHSLNLPAAISEFEYLQELKQIAAKNKLFKTYIGQGYYDTITPSVIQRNVFENPGWYTSYTPYQSEISQGRLESLLNFQTVITDLTGLEIANASLLDEGTAAAEAMSMLFHHVNKTETPGQPKFFVDQAVFPQTKDLLITRSVPIGVELVFGDYKSVLLDNTYFGALIQYPNDNGSVEDYRGFIANVHNAGGFVVMATDLLALTLLTAPGELGADVAVGSAQRFGVPLGYGGPHAGFFATKDEFKRGMPGRLIGISVDAQGNRALRMALQTREQHIKREKATSNICTAQALLANMAAMYAVYHGPDGLKQIALRIAILTQTLSNELNELGFENCNTYYFDTLKIKTDAAKIKTIAEKYQTNFRYFDDNHVGISLDETTTQKDILDIVYIFAGSLGKSEAGVSFDSEEELMNLPPFALRHTSYLTHPVFNTHHSESQMMRYMKQLENKDLSLNTSMISLGSCTLKLNAATEMIPVSWPEFSRIHPFAPRSQTLGYQYIIDELSNYLCKITGFDACSLQPNSGAQGEYTGLLTIKGYHRAQGNEHRNVVLIPISAHGTNPASAVLAGMKVVVIKGTEDGLIDVDDLKAKAEQYKDTLCALMVTYPSTHGVFEESIREICEIIHRFGGQVYMDGANMNAQVGLTSPAFIGADLCHLNLHKTFAIPHGGGGPGVGPICAAKHLAPYLPSHLSLAKEGESLAEDNHQDLHLAAGTTRTAGYGAVSSAPYGSASILLISYAYIKMLGYDGLQMATEYAILNANYMKARLEKAYQILYTGINGTVAHEFIVDLRPFKHSAGIEADDVAKRLIDYGFHAPTISFPVPGTIMIEPTESEDKAELDRFCDALLSIYEEIKAIEEGKADKTDNVLKNAPHTQAVVCSDEWEHAYSRKEAAFPLYYVTQNKFWPAVARINNTYGDRNLICTCEPMEAYIN
jgi:glycine dehydrogenase